MNPITALSRMQEMTALGADWWNDSGMPSELAEAVALGATGGTSNPVIVAQAARNNPDYCLPVIRGLIAEHAHATEDELAWRLIAVLGQESAAKLRPVYDATGGMKGFLSMQVNPKFYRNAGKMVAQAVELAALAPNIAIKIPATAEGIEAMEEATARGIRVNATVSFSVPQALAVAEAFARGLRRAPAPDRIRPYITLMIGRVDDHLQRVADAGKISVSPGLIPWAGIAVFKRASRLLQERRLPGTLLAAAYRHEGHWAEIVGPGVFQTIPYTWWRQFNASPRAVAPTLAQAVDAGIVAELREKFPDFVKAYDEDGMAPADFVRYGATIHTLEQFLGGYADLLTFVRGAMLH